jgi:ABC-type nitrate/sulfonate/bicarbonate transport system substrate-binding protein
MIFKAGASPIAHHPSGLLIPVEVRPDICAALAARAADEAWFAVGHVGPSVAADRRRMRTVVVGALNQDAAHALLAHLGAGRIRYPAGYPGL